MNTATGTKKNHPDCRELFKRAGRLYKHNKLHEALELLLKLKHHGYDSPDYMLMLAKVYDRLAYITGESEYEDLALETYDDIINYSRSRRFRRKALKLQNRLAKKISRLNEDEYRAQSKAASMECDEPRSPKSWFMLGANFSVRKDPFFVINAYENAVKLNPNYIAALFRIGYIYHHNLEDSEKAMTFYHKIIRIAPYDDEVEPESVNVRTIIDTLGEMSQIYMKTRNFRKVISVFDHTMTFYNNYSAMCTMENIKGIIANANTASEKLGNNRALKKYVLENYGYNFDNLLNELRLSKIEKGHV